MFDKTFLFPYLTEFAYKRSASMFAIRRTHFALQFCGYFEMTSTGYVSPSRKCVKIRTIHAGVNINGHKSRVSRNRRIKGPERGPVRVSKNARSSSSSECSSSRLENILACCRLVRVCQRSKIHDETRLGSLVDYGISSRHARYVLHYRSATPRRLRNVNPERKRRGRRIVYAEEFPPRGVRKL